MANSDILNSDINPVNGQASLESAYRKEAFFEWLITQILSERFTNGFRIASPIDLERFRRFVSDYSNDKTQLSDDELMKAIDNCGMSFDGKVYVVSEQTKSQVKEIAKRYFSDGAKIIFYASFYAKNEDWLFSASIISEDMLIVILRKLFPKLSFTQTYFGYLNTAISDALESEILRVWADDVLLTYEQLAERLHYIPIEKIKYTLGQNSDFIWNNTSTFSHVSKINITANECKAIRKAAQRECKANGYISITDLPLGEIVERNYELTLSAVHNAAFRICLSDKFDKKGKIINRKGTALNALTIMKEYCRSLDSCSLDDLLEFEKNLTGEIHRWVPMQAGYDIMVRTDKNTFLAEKYLDFDVVAIDNAIENFICGEYIPLRSITTFVLFPYCGQVWTLFLLESYVRRFSNKFRFETSHMNSKNAGCIIRKHSKLTYDDIMTDAIDRSNVQLNENAIAEFLFENGYRGSRQKSNFTDLIMQVKDLRKKR